MKRIFRLLLVGMLSVLSFSMQAQYLRTSFIMKDSHLRNQLNPALLPDRGYVDIPAIGAFRASVNSPSLGYQDIMDIVKNSGDNRYFMSEDFISRLDIDNKLNLNITTDIVSAGWFSGRNYWSVNIGFKNDIGASVPRSMFEFMRDMSGIDPNRPSTFANLNSMVGLQSLHFNSYLSAGFGYTRQLTDRLTVGAKVKFLLGLDNIRLDINHIKVNSRLVGLDNWDNVDWGSLTPEQIQNIGGSAEIDVCATLENSSRMFKMQQGETSNYVDAVKYNTFGFGGYGASFDLGVSYRITNGLTVSASVLDLGGIKWRKSNTDVAVARGSQKFSLMNDQEKYEFISKVQSGEVFNYEILELQLDESLSKTRNAMVPATMAVGAEYSFLNDLLIVGALYTGHFVKPYTLNELTISASVCPKSFFNFGVSYSVLQGAGKTFGAAMKLGPLFIGTDYMFLGDNTKNLNAYLGITVPLGKNTCSKKKL